MRTTSLMVLLLLAAVTPAGASDKAPAAPAALVVIDPEISQFNVATDRVQAYIPVGPTAAQVGLFPAAVGQTAREIRLQTFANRLAEPLISQFTQEQLLEAVKSGVRTALQRDGIEDVKFMFVKDPTSEMVDRVRHNKQLKRVLIIDNETLERYAPSIVMLSGDYRQLRITMRTHSFARNDKNMLRPNAGKRAVVVETLARPGPSHAVLADRVAEGGAAFLKEVSAAIAQSVEAATTTPDANALRATDNVYWVNAAGAFGTHGKKVDLVDGRLRVVDIKGNVGVYPADEVL